MKANPSSSAVQIFSSISKTNPAIQEVEHVTHKIQNYVSNTRKRQNPEKLEDADRVEVLLSKLTRPFDPDKNGTLFLVC